MDSSVSSMSSMPSNDTVLKVSGLLLLPLAGLATVGMGVAFYRRFRIRAALRARHDQAIERFVSKVKGEMAAKEEFMQRLQFARSRRQGSMLGSSGGNHSASMALAPVPSSEGHEGSAP
eukprot:RCo050604